MKALHFLSDKSLVVRSPVRIPLGKHRPCKSGYARQPTPNPAPDAYGIDDFTHKNTWVRSFQPHTKHEVKRLNCFVRSPSQRREDADRKFGCVLIFSYSASFYDIMLNSPSVSQK